MHESTRYPSAAHEVLTFLRSPSATQIITNTTDKIPAINSQQLRTIDIPLDKSQQALGHNQARTKPLVAIPNHSDKLLWDVFDDIDIVETIKEVYAHRMTPEEAQDEIVENYQEWIEQYQ
jgi:Zn ribbon nucleic-acid-binding protein